MSAQCMVSVRFTPLLALFWIPFSAHARSLNPPGQTGATALVSGSVPNEEGAAPMRDFLDESEKVLREKNALCIPLLFEWERGKHSARFKMFPLGGLEFDRATQSRSWFAGPIPSLLEHVRVHDRESRLRNSENAFLGIRFAHATNRSGQDLRIVDALPVLSSWMRVSNKDLSSTALISVPLITAWVHEKRERSEFTGFWSLPLLSIGCTELKDGVREQTVANLFLGGWSRSSDVTSVVAGPLGCLWTMDRRPERREVGVLWSLLYCGVKDSKTEYSSHSVTPFFRYECSKGRRTFRLLHWIQIPLGTVKKPGDQHISR